MARVKIHGNGTPGDTSEIRRHLAVRLGVMSSRSMSSGGGGMPVKGKNEAAEASGAMIADAYHGRTPDKPGDREVFILVRHDEEPPQCPVFVAGDAGQDEAIAVFSSREQAVLFLQVAAWEKPYDAMPLAPPELEELVEDARGQGVKFVAVDLNRQGQTRGTPQNVIDVEKLPDRSGENLYHEVWDLGNTPGVAGAARDVGARRPSGSP